MNSNEILQADLLDILFEGRNKQYGAYILRKHYNKRMLFSLGIALPGILALLLLFPRGGTLTVKPPQVKEDLTLITVVIPDDELKPPPPATPRPPSVPAVAQQAFHDNIRLVDKTPVNAMIAQDLIINVSDVTMDGDPVPAPYVAPVPPVSTEPSAGMQPNATVEAPIQREPEFPGGLQAWLNFLQRNLEVPSALEAGEKKTVMIRFQVAADGMVTGFEVAKSGGRLYDNEVIRVLKRMPRWKPAIQNNIPVARSFTQPVTFVGVEE